MRRSLLFVSFALLCVSAALAQNPARASSAPQMSITLGHSVAAIDGPWRFHIGDSPQWSSPSFDDSSWETTNVGTPADSYDPNAGTAGFVPGWTAKGHPGYSGFAWYRIRIHLNGANGPLSLLAPSDVDDSYQLFINGRLLGSFGDFNRRLPSVYITHPRMFRIPGSILRPGGTMDIAFRFYMAPIELTQIAPGGMHNPPYIGFTDAIVSFYHVQWEVMYRSTAPSLVDFLIYLLFTLLIFMLYAFDRTERILLLPLAACVLEASYTLVLLAAADSSLLTASSMIYGGATLVPASIIFWALTWWAYFGLGQKKWLRNATIIIGAFATTVLLLFHLFTTNSPHAPHYIFIAYSIATGIFNVALAFVVALIAWFGIRQAQKIDWMLLLALIFYGIPAFSILLRMLHIRTAWFPFGINLQLSTLTSLASLFCFSFVLMRRFRASQRRQQAMLEDVKQAQEVQQVLIPEESPNVPGLTIESEYRPAREVGGDFFQIIPHPTDGSVLIVAGDVTGKGLKAGMLVAVLVGGIRSTVELNPDPVFLLKALNRRLTGRGDAHATALAMRIAADGSVTLANAGHLPPYRNGKPVSVDGALPLGFVPNFEPSVTRFQLNEGDHLVLVSDGIAEAMDANGHLFGFERIEQMLAQQHGKVSPADLASAAQSFGQQDDISVIAITRALSPKEALA
ncbi:MAG TPA: SpoIIE family protein phosphatase [Acidobacteriaceae bacterium]|nr:SpoIIE family protein phosphatase [Acidobacteriaceae bacterium]